MTPEQGLDLLRVASYFHDSRLQEYLLVKYLIPMMNAKSAVLFISELHSWPTLSPCEKLPSKRVAAFLQDYSVFFLVKNLAVILRHERRILIELQPDHLWELVRMSFGHIIDAKADLEMILGFAIEVFTTEDKGIFSLFDLVHSRVKDCCHFDSQAIAQIRDIKDLDPSIQTCIGIIKGYNFDALQSVSKPQVNSNQRDSAATLEDGYLANELD